MMAWWQQKPMRLIQTNLRETDALLDIDEYMQSLEEFSADALLFNVGGIVANYPSELEFHYVNSHMKEDFTGKVIERVHKRGMKFIARFDFSRLNEVHALSNQDWLYRSADGKKIVNYNGQVHTCINGYYQQDYSLKVLREVVEKYPIDGVFFNMIGYVMHDYSYNIHGICQCENCHKRFAERTGHERLPVKPEANDPIYRDYQRFQKETVNELFERRVAVVKSHNPEIAIVNYTHGSSDVYRKESNSGIERPLPEWNYSATENVRTVHSSWDGMAVSNSAVHFVDYAMRHVGVSPHLTSLRLVQSMVNGGWLDYYVIGTLVNQEDRTCFDGVKDMFRYHKEHEQYYTNLRSLAEVCLIVPESRMPGSKKELQGIMRMLSENHVQYDLLHSSVLESPDLFEKLQRYKVLILPDQRIMSDEAVAVIDRFVEQGGKLLATGSTSTCDRKGHPLEQIRLRSLGVKEFVHAPKVLGSYFRIREEDKGKLRGFENIDLVYLYGEKLECKLEDGAVGLLGLIPECMFGPPEKCYFTKETDIPGLIANDYGRGKSAYLPWGLGSHYDKLSNHGHARLFMAALQDVLGHREQLELTASPMVEVSYHEARGNSRRLVSAINVSGQLGTAFHAPLPIRNLHFRVKAERKPSRIHALRRSGDIPFDYNDGGLSFTLDELELFETIVIED
jgi:hypothetical protein